MAGLPLAPPGYGPPTGYFWPPPDADGLRLARRFFVAGAVLPFAAAAAFLYIGATAGNNPPTRDVALYIDLAIAMATGPAMMALTWLGMRASKRAGVRSTPAIAVVELVFGALAVLAGVWVTFLLSIVLTVPPFY